MRNRALHDALRDFAAEAAAVLAGELESGAELAFDVSEESGRGPVLYRYQPLTGRFIDDRWASLRELGSCRPACRELATGAAAYLRLQGLSGKEAEPALRAMLHRLYEDASAFDFPEERFERVYAEVERTLYESSVRSTVLVPVSGLALESPRVDVADGLSLRRAEAVEAPPSALRTDPRAPGDDPEAFLVLEEDVPADEPPPLADAARRLRDLAAGLRLFKAGSLGPSPVSWARIDDGPWQPAAVGLRGHVRGAPWLLGAAEEAELVEFLAAVAASRTGGRVMWAQDRFVMGCERELETEALSDYLMALTALLDGAGETGRASMSLRLAALCADESDRRGLQRRLELAFALERFLIGGGDGAAYAETIGFESPFALIDEIEEHLRALLRDVRLGYLDADLKGTADEILLETIPVGEIRVRDLRREAAATRRDDESAPDDEPEDEEPPDAEARLDNEPSPEDAEGEAEPDREPVPVARAEAAPDDAVTPSADWGFDEDAESYSAPV